MHFQETKLKDVFTIILEPIRDRRGFFARSFCKREFEKRGLKHDFVQFNISYNHKKGTLRGLHYQNVPHAETKIVSCRQGAIFDVVVDLRKDSPTYGEWISVELTAKNYKALYVPEGFAHGFQTLCDDSEVFYQMGNYYYPVAATGIRWDDAYLNISWPYQEIIISENDKQLPSFTL